MATAPTKKRQSAGSGWDEREGETVATFGGAATEDAGQFDQTKGDARRPYPTPEPALSNPRTIYPRSQPPAGRPFYFAESPVSPAQAGRPLPPQAGPRSDERRSSQYGSDDAPAIYAAQPSHYSTVSTWGNFSSPAAKPELMATAHGTMGPQPVPYHTPQSNSPASVASPHHTHMRPMYPPNVQHPAHMYYGAYGSHQQPQYGYAGQMQQPSLPSHNSHYQMPQYPQSHHMQQQPHQPHHPGFDSHQPPKLMQMPMQPPDQHLSPSQMPLGSRPLQMPQPPSAGTSQSAAAPGPIRATTPLVVKQDVNGVTTISFEYSKDRVKQPYEIRCDVESVDVKNLSQEHKNENCVYPRACSGEPYKGNRWQYENECNEVAWALAYLNPELKGKRGLIQRAVDSWRNSNKDRKLRSRRVRRMAKTEKRAQQQQQQIPNRPYAPPPVSSAAAPGGMAVGNAYSHPVASHPVGNAGTGQYHTHPVHHESGHNGGNAGPTSTQ